MSSWPALIAEASQHLTRAGLDSPAADARILAEHVAGSHPLVASDPDDDAVVRFRELVAERATRIPLQHLTGVMYFRYLELVSEPGCFIVRPETEVVAEEAIVAARAREGAVVVDLCTGSGAIALAVATEVPGAQVYAVELSEQAYDVAQRNNRAYGNVVHLVRGDARTALGELVGHCDVVVTNPPYVPPMEVSPEVQADPALALWGGGPDGLDMPKDLVRRAVELAKPGGILVMEHAEEQAAALCDYALAHGFVEARTGVDLTGRPRLLWARKRGEERGDDGSCGLPV